MAHLSNPYEEPSASALAVRLKQNTRRIETQLKALIQVFVLHKIDPHPLSTGKSLYYLIDPGIVTFYRGDFQAQINAAFLLEFLAKQSYLALSGVRFSYYRGAKGGRVSLLVETSPKSILSIKWLDTEGLDLRELAILRSFESKAAKQKIEVTSLVLCGVSRRTKADGITILPWEFVF